MVFIEEKLKEVDNHSAEEQIEQIFNNKTDENQSSQLSEDDFENMDDDTEEESYDWKYSKIPEVSEMQEKNDEDSFTPDEESSDSQKINMFEEDINLKENEKEEAKEDEKID